MAGRKSLFRTVAAALGAAALLACGIAGAGTANAGTVPTSGSDGQITVNNAAQGHEFKAVRIGSYSRAESKGSAISKLEVTKLTPSTPFSDAVDSAAAAVSGVGTPADSKCGTDNVCWISKHWIGYDNGHQDNYDTTSSHASAGYAGQLREFVTKLQDQPDFKSAISSASSVTESGGQAKFTELPQGLYVIEDVTSQGASGSPKSIPMLAGTTVGSDHLDSFVGVGLLKLGQINTKKGDAPTILKKWVSTTDANKQRVRRADIPFDGDIMHFELKTNVPMTAGFSHYFFKITDNPSAGLAYVPNSAKATVDGQKIDIVPAPASAPTPTPNQVYFDQGNDQNGAPYLGFTFPNVLAYTYYALIVVTYDAKVVQPGRQKNVAGIDWSNNIDSQPNEFCVADSAVNCGAVGQIESNIIKFATYYLQFKTTGGSKDKVPTGGTTFEVYRKGDKKPLTFRKLTDGSYVYHPAEDEASDPTSQLTVGTGKHTADGGLGLGGLKIDGLPPGIYTIKGVTPPSSDANAKLVDFDVKITEDPSNNGAYVTIIRDDANNLVVNKPVSAGDHLGANITLNVAKAPENIIDHINHGINNGINHVINGAIGLVTGNKNPANNGAGGNGTASNGAASNGTGSNGPGSNGSGPLSVLATTGISIVALLVLLCASVIVGTALMRRRHRIQR